MKFAFIDLETTGGKAQRERVTEIAVVLYENGEQLDSWQTLINPERALPPFISRLTGIYDEMLADAPVFADIADQFDQLTEGCVFVAHNARFDYSFIKAEFKRLGRAYQRKTLCTVKLSRALFPEHKSHSLDSLIKRYALPIAERHRAMGDVRATLAFFCLAKQRVGNERFDMAINTQLRRPSLPQCLDHVTVDQIPEEPGIYRFYGESGALLYVGKSVNLRQRVLSHFASDHASDKELTLATSIRGLDWQQCAGDLGAQLLEVKEIRERAPVYNRRSRKSEDICAYQLKANADGYLSPVLVKAPTAADLHPETEAGFELSLYALSRSQSAAKRKLNSVKAKNELCARILGIEQGDGSCFEYQTGECAGACLALEDVERYNLRMMIAFAGLSLRAWPYDGPVLLWERGQAFDQWHLVSGWRFIKSFTDLDQAQEALVQFARHEDPVLEPDEYRILSRFLHDPANQKRVLISATN